MSARITRVISLSVYKRYFANEILSFFAFFNPAACLAARQVIYESHLSASMCACTSVYMSNVCTRAHVYRFHERSSCITPACRNFNRNSRRIDRSREQSSATVCGVNSSFQLLQTSSDYVSIIVNVNFLIEALAIHTISQCYVIKLWEEIWAEKMRIENRLVIFL